MTRPIFNAKQECMLYLSRCDASVSGPPASLRCGVGCALVFSFRVCANLLRTNLPKSQRTAFVLFLSSSPSNSATRPSPGLVPVSTSRCALCASRPECRKGSSNGYPLYSSPLCAAPPPPRPASNTTPTSKLKHALEDGSARGSNHSSGGISVGR